MNSGALAAYLADVPICPNCRAARTTLKLKCPKCGWLYKVKKLPREAVVIQRYVEPKPRRPRISTTRVRHPDEVYEKHARRQPQEPGSPIIRIRGFSVPAADIEKRLLEHPSVTAACAVLRLVKANKVPAIVAFVSLAEGVQAWQGISSDLREWCRGGMPAWKMPDRVLQVRNVADRQTMAREPLRRLHNIVPAPIIRNPLNEFRFEGVVRDLWSIGGRTRFVVAQREAGRPKGIALTLVGGQDLYRRLKQGSLVTVEGKFGARVSLRALEVVVRERQTLIRLSNTKAVLEAL